jgi:uncharacterized protein HemY
MAHGRDHLTEQTGDAKAAEADNLLSQAAACTKRGETGHAERLIRMLLAREPQHPGALYELGRISYRAGNKVAAADCLRKAIASQPGNPIPQRARMRAGRARRSAAGVPRLRARARDQPR